MQSNFVLGDDKILDEDIYFSKQIVFHSHITGDTETI